MNNESKKDYVIGMLYALATSFEHEFNSGQNNTYKVASVLINEIYEKEAKDES